MRINNVHTRESTVTPYQSPFKLRLFTYLQYPLSIYQAPRPHEPLPKPIPHALMGMRPTSLTTSTLRFRLRHRPDFRRQHQRTPIVSPVEVGHHHGCLLGLVFVDEMAGVGEDLELVFAYRWVSVSLRSLCRGWTR